MKLDSEAKQAHARALIDDPVFIEIMDGLEEAAIDKAIFADTTDSDLRHAALTEARSIRQLRAKLKNLAARGDLKAG